MHSDDRPRDGVAWMRRTEAQLRTLDWRIRNLPPASGPQGPQGAPGAQGPQGSTGATGPQGTQGAQGSTGAQGPQGTQGSQGAQGAQGVAGPPPGMRWKYDVDSQVMSDPGAGYWRLNIGGTQLVVSQTTENAIDAGTWLGLITVGDVLGITTADGVSQAFSTVTSISDQGAYWLLGLSFVGGSGFFSDEDITRWTFSRRGPQGAQGATGAQGSQGTQGVQGAQGAQGAQGTQGSQGAQGTQGTQGFQGTATSNTSFQVAQTANVTPNGSANSTLTGLSQAVTSPGTSSVYLVTIDADVECTVAANINIIELLVDGVAQTASIVTGHPTTALRLHPSKTWRITGLSAGSHTFTARTRNVAAGTQITVNVTHTVMTVLLAS